PEDLVEIDDSVEFPAAENPFVDLPAHALLLRRIESDRFGWGTKLQESVLKRAVGGPDDSDSLLVGARDELPISGDDVLGRDACLRRRQRAGEDDVIDTETQDDVPDAGLVQDIALEARQSGLAEHRAELAACRLPGTVIQQAVANDPFIQHSQFPFASAF